MADVFFKNNPNPMWIFEPQSLQIKAVNDAATAFYGYPKEEMLSMTINDLRPKNEISRLHKEIGKGIQDFSNAGIWLHKKRNGDQIHVRIFSYPIEWEGEKCKLVVAQDISEQKDIEQQYLVEQKLLEVIMQNLPGIFCVFDRNGKIYRWNRKITEVTGYSGESIKKMTPDQLFAENERADVRMAIERAFTDGYHEIQANLLTNSKDKIPLYFRIGKADFHGESHLIGVGMDISNLRKAEFKWEQNRLLLNAILEQAGSVITVKDRDGCYQLVNRKYCETFELEPEDVIGKKVSDIYDEKIAEVLRKNDSEVYDKGGAIEIEKNFNTPGGGRTFVVVKYLLKDVPGYEDSICSIATDITEIKKTEKKLQQLYKREREERLRIERINSRLKLLENVGDLFTGKKNDHRTALQKTAKLLTKEVADICVFDVYEDEELERVAQQLDISSEKEKIVHQIREKYPEFFYKTEILKSVLEKGEPFLGKKFTTKELNSLVQNQDQFELLNKLGIQSYFLLPLRVKDKIVGVKTLIILSEDRKFTDDDLSYLTELADKIALHIENSLINEKLRDFNKELELKVKERTKQLENTNEELESFSYSVSHDLRSPLRAISGYTNLLLEDYYEKLRGEGQEFLTIINKETKRMGTLIDDLLSFSRLNRKEKAGQIFSMNSLVRECFNEVMRAYEVDSPEIEIKELPMIYGDPKLLRQVWVNLISNAIKYQENGQKICISIGMKKDEQKGHLVFFIKDNGVGFDMKYSDKLFGVFQRLHSDEEFEGTGIGLALVRRIINRHGGEVWAESRVGEGSTFYFSLPDKQTG